MLNLKQLLFYYFLITSNHVINTFESINEIGGTINTRLKITSTSVTPFDMTTTSQQLLNNSLNLADTPEYSSEELSSHELLLKTSAAIKEAFIVSEKNNMIYIQEKQFDPRHRRHAQQISRNATSLSSQLEQFKLWRKQMSRKNFTMKSLSTGIGTGNGVGYSSSFLPMSDSDSVVSSVGSGGSVVTGYAYNLQHGVFCSFEVECDWFWNKTSDFSVTNGGQLTDSNIGPKFDADNKTIGNFLFLKTSHTSRDLQLISPIMTAPSGEQCRLEIYLHQTNMNDSVIKLIVKNTKANRTQWIAHEMLGNSNRIWIRYLFKVGRVTQDFRLILEILPHFTPGYMAIDNIRMVDCYPEPAKRNMCVQHQFRCASTNVCVNMSQVCDINRDCKNEEDELQDCDKIPFGGRCDFEDGWCGWENDPTKQIQWIRNQGQVNKSSPAMDHTYHNTSGHYLLVNMTKYIHSAQFAASALVSSAIFNPPPSVHSNESSPYYNSCMVRFYYHQNGVHKSGLSLLLIEMKSPYENVSTEIWWRFADKEDKWHKQTVILPNITHRYFLQFNAKKGLRFLSIVAIDDISLSPECFGLNIPATELKGYNYWNPLYIESKIKETHKDFINKTLYEFTTCGVSGQNGPKPENCTDSYRDTPLENQVEVLEHEPFIGVQRWIVPSTGYYTIIAKGASGGKGSGGMGSSRGAMVKGVLELHRGERLYILVGQEGRSACIKSLGRSASNSSCEAFLNEGNLTGIRGVFFAILRDGGGGGGGATYIFRVQKRNNKPVLEPLMVAAGGGGLGLGKFVDNNLHHGFGIKLKKPVNGHTRITDKTSGAGGGLFRDPHITRSVHNGNSLEDGSRGGFACYNSKDGAGSGGFGGGGGGCTNGGGGGGYAGGNSWTINTTNGEGGTSYITNETLEMHREVIPGEHTGSGQVLIIPAESEKCGCNYRCIALDENRALTACICPKPNWFLGQDNVTCVLTDVPSDGRTLLIGILFLVILLLAIGFGILCIMLYNRHQRRKSETSRRKMLSGPELQLNRLRMPSDSNVLLTEYNPNYEFGGQVYTLRDLQDIPRDQLRLVKALGQGAFGEVYQGFFRARQNDAVEMPVAVKTLPEMSTQQAEMDFLMEALIMSKFNHPNIVHFIGVCFDKHPRFIVLELLAGGDLKNFLRESRPKPERTSPLTMKDLVLIAIDVAKGCKYMEEHRFIHRDIAARNCLLTTKGPGRVVKIADFGMSRDIYRSDYYRKGGKAMLPIKWMPPEAFLDGIFTSKTDVWSFGVLLWEILSMGFMPYTGCSNRQVMQLVTSGGRLEPPSNCPAPVYGIMTQCWHPTPEQRPTFSMLLERLGYCIQDPDVVTNPLPVFTKAPSAERDTTVMRPKNTDGSYLQVSNNTDYLVPTPTVTPCTTSTNDCGSVETLLDEDETDVNDDSWETSFMMSQSKSNQPLLDNMATITPNNGRNSIITNTNSIPPSTMNKLINIDTAQSSLTNNNNNQAQQPTALLINHNNHTAFNNNIKSSTNSNNNTPVQLMTTTSNDTQTSVTNTSTNQPPTATIVKNLKSGVSLDATNLLNQTKKSYANIQPTSHQNGPYSLDSSKLINHKKTAGADIVTNDSEISC